MSVYALSSARWLVGAGLLAAGMSPSSTASAQRLDTLALERALLQEQRALAAPGVAISIVVGDSVVYSRGFGVSSIEDRVALTPATLFRLGSTTKMFTGLTAVLLDERGTLRLDAPIARHASGLHPQLGRLTLRQLLSHTAGLINEGAANGPHDDDALGRRVRSWTAKYSFAPPGDIYSYSSPGYWLAGYAIEQAAKEPYADVVRHAVLAPLGMTRSAFRPLEAMTYPIALDHRVTNGTAAVLRPFTDDATTWPSGSLFSSSQELARFAVAMVNQGRLDGKQVLPASAVRRMYEAQSAVPTGDCSYTFGLSSCPSPTGRRFNHYGFRLGSGSVITLVPERRIGIIILSNRNGGIFGRTEAKALELLLSKDSTSDREPPLRPLAREQLTAFTGLWVNGPDSLRLSVRKDSLFYTYGGKTFSTAGRGERELVVLEEGQPVQAFTRVVGKSGRPYLHDGLSAFARSSP